VLSEDASVRSLAFEDAVDKVRSQRRENGLQPVGTRLGYADHDHPVTLARSATRLLKET
jgi:hypothetical protein